jgi:hypothetical protein
MNKRCHIVQDLLPSYIDKLCSEDSREFVEEHLSSCNGCMEVYNNMKSEDIKEDVAIERIDAKKPFQKISQFFRAQVKLTRTVFISAVISLIIGVLLLGNSIMVMNAKNEELNGLSKVEREKDIIMSDVFRVLHSTNDAGEPLQDIFKKYDDKLQYLAVFKAESLQELLSDSSGVKQEPTNIHPIDYQNAEVVIGSEGIISNNAAIIPSKYDLGNVVMADDNWVVQFEYKESYEDTIERYHQLNYYGPTLLTIYWPPILFLSIFGILFMLWWMLRKHNKRLQDVMG